jgi:hypothetical protein
LLFISGINSSVDTIDRCVAHYERKGHPVVLARGFPAWGSLGNPQGWFWHDAISEDGVTFAGLWLKAIAERRDRLTVSRSLTQAWVLAANHDYPPKVVRCDAPDWRDELDDPAPILFPNEETVHWWLKAPGPEIRLRIDGTQVPRLGGGETPRVWISPVPPASLTPAGIAWVRWGDHALDRLNDEGEWDELGHLKDRAVTRHYLGEFGWLGCDWGAGWDQLEGPRMAVRARFPDWVDLPEVAVLVQATAEDIHRATASPFPLGAIVIWDGRRLPDGAAVLAERIFARWPQTSQVIIGSGSETLNQQPTAAVAALLALGADAGGVDETGARVIRVRSPYPTRAGGIQKATEAARRTLERWGDQFAAIREASGAF